jgi:cytochrome P450
MFPFYVSYFPFLIPSRFAGQDCTLPTGQQMKKGDRLLYLSIFVHRDPAYFPRPLEFIPGEC